MQARFGVQLRNFPSEYTHSIFEKIRESARVCESLGFDSLWMIDHLALRPPIAPESQPIPDCWTTISFLASQTSRLELGSLVTSVLFREPAYLAKVCSTLNLISNNRLIVGIGSGWHEDEFKSYGIDFPRSMDRVRLVEKAIIEIRERCRQDNALSGRSSSRIPPVWMGGSGEKLTLRLAARLADGSNLQGNESVIAHKISVLRDFCARFSRPLDNMVVSKQTNVIIDTTEDNIARKLRKIIPDESRWKPFRENNIVGTPEECLSQIARFSKLGIDYFTLNFPDLFELESIRLFDQEVIRRVRTEVYA